jgi:hypothetical protein
VTFITSMGSVLHRGQITVSCIDSELELGCVSPGFFYPDAMIIPLL